MDPGSFDTVSLPHLFRPSLSAFTMFGEVRLRGLLYLGAHSMSFIFIMGCLYLLLSRLLPTLLHRNAVVGGC